MWCTTHVHHVYVDICHFELWHDADNINECFECDSSSNMSSERWDGSFEYPRQVFVVKKPSYTSITHSYLEVWLLFFVYFLQEKLQWRQRTAEAHCVKFWNLFCKPIPMRKHAMLSFAVLVEDLLGRFMYISHSSDLICIQTVWHFYGIPEISRHHCPSFNHCILSRMSFIHKGDFGFEVDKECFNFWHQMSCQTYFCMLWALVPL